MALSIRLSRAGRKKSPFYRIVVADKRAPRDGRYIERLGSYNPLLPQDSDERITLVEERIKYWLSQGAKPSERVSLFLGKAGIIDMPEQPSRPKKSAPSEKTKMKIADKEERLKAAAEAAKAAEEEAKAAEEAAAAAAAAPAEETKTEEAPAESPKAEEAPAEEKAESSSAEEEKKEG